MEEGISKSPANCPNVEGDYDARQWDTREDCEVRQILDRVADKWSLLVIALLDRRVLRFTELSREVDGISQRMLTVTLRQLERDGLVRRTVHPVVPPRVDYELTPLGVTLHDTIQSLVMWTEKHQNEIAAARADYDARADVAPAAPVAPLPVSRETMAAGRTGARPVAPVRNGTAAVGRNGTLSAGRNGTLAAGRDGARAASRNGTPAASRNGTPTAVTGDDGARAVAVGGDGSRAGATMPRCETCGTPIHLARTGRPARFCGTACRQKAHRRRSRAGAPGQG
ncbi:transcriptional regulator, HxlR family [Streptosporangium canum]|uniref:Transcriptional regulator, HxlR family n=1 Tax=Streptosporangium canum TaxID=324952 RepID=A0A1I3WGW8_9ACTN|nr:transcriptional regulator, HxlR family [Streptosporangium canum]